MKIRSMQTCIMSSLRRCVFRCSVFRYVTLDNFFKLCYLIVISFTLVANKYLLTYLDHPDPLKANFTPRQIAKASATKRKPPFDENHGGWYAS